MERPHGGPVGRIAFPFEAAKVFHQGLFVDRLRSASPVRDIHETPPGRVAGRPPAVGKALEPCAVVLE